MPDNETWVLVADGARARLLRVDHQARRLETLRKEDSAAARGKSAELVSDRPGRAFESSASAKRSAMEPQTDPKQLEKQRFARHLAGLLGEAESQGRFERLVVVAAPQTLGDLRAELSLAVRSRVDAELDKDSDAERCRRSRPASGADPVAAGALRARQPGSPFRLLARGSTGSRGRCPPRRLAWAGGPLSPSRCCPRRRRTGRRHRTRAPRRRLRAACRAAPGPRPFAGSIRRRSLSSPSQVPCQSSPSTQVTPVTTRLDSMVRRMAPVSGSI